MTILLSPAKSLDFEQTLITDQFSYPEFLDKSQPLINTLKRKSRKAIKELMGISDNLAISNKERYESFSVPFTPENARHALAFFKGEVYLGLEATSLSKEDLEFAQKHLRILSGLYGVLKPLDLIQPYRLEMGTRLKFRNKKNLYEYWGDSITQSINAELDAADGFVINLASQEYFKAIQPKLLKTPVYHINFKEYKDTELTFISFNAKRSRGLMAKWIIENRINHVDQLYQFNLDRYNFDHANSDKYNLTFTRDFKKAVSKSPKTRIS